MDFPAHQLVKKKKSKVRGAFRLFHPNALPTAENLSARSVKCCLTRKMVILTHNRVQVETGIHRLLI